MGTWSLRQFLQKWQLDPSHGIRHLWPCLSTFSLRAFAFRRILQTDFINPKHDPDAPPIDTSESAPTIQNINGDPPWEWMPMVDPSDQFDTPGTNLVGISGWVAMPLEVAQNQGISTGDVPFTHPFDFDWEFFVAPDPEYSCFISSANKANYPRIDKEYKGAIDDIPNVVDLRYSGEKKVIYPFPGVLGVETDQDLVPSKYRADRGYRVAVFGRWIVDAGHPDFHREIHPPLLLASAKEISGDETASTVVGRPFLVGQQFDEGGLVKHLIVEVEKILMVPGACKDPVTGLPLPPGVPCSTQIEAHPKILPKPFRGNPSMSYIVRPKFSQNSPGDRLMVLFHFTVRTGVTVKLSSADFDGVRVSIDMKEQEYTAPDPTGNSNPDISISELVKLMGLDWAQTVANIFDAVPHLFAFKGIKTDRYAAPVASSVHDSEVTTVAMDNLGSVAYYSVDDSQPFPIYGSLDVRWERH